MNDIFMERGQGEMRSFYCKCKCEPLGQMNHRLNFGQVQDRRDAPRQAPYFLCKRQQKVSKKWLFPAGGISVAVFIVN